LRHEAASAQNRTHHSAFLRLAPPPDPLCWIKHRFRPQRTASLAKARVLTLDTYESMVQSGRYLTVPAGRDPDRMGLPPGREWDNVALVHGGYLMRETVAESEVGKRIQRDIEARGYAIHEIDITAYEPKRG